MSQNLLKRIFTSIILISILFLVNFSHQYVFVFAILIVGTLVCIEANNLFLKLLIIKSKNKYFLKKINFKFLILNIITFSYIFLIFCNCSLEIHKYESPFFFIYIICICFFTDIGGYVFGKIIGGKKLSKISPNKTISGTIGSFVFSIFPLILISNLNYLDLALNLKNIIFCFLISLISQLGDLFISFIKRKAKVKDTGNMLPGHGGILDRVDGIIFAVPFSYFLIKLI